MKAWLRKNEKAVYRVICAGLLACTALFGGERFLCTGGMDGIRLFAAAAVLGVAAGMNFLAVRGRILCLGFVLILICTGAAAAGLENSLAFLRDFLPWLMGGGEAPEEWIPGYGLLQTAVIVIICYFIQIMFENIPLLKAGGGAAAFLAALFCLLTGREAGHYGAACLFCYLVLVWEERVQKQWKKVRRGTGGQAAHTLWIMPFLAVYLVFMAVMPAPAKPYDWMWAKNIYHHLRETIYAYTQDIKWGGREGFGMTFAGFSEEGELHGDLQQESRETMTVQVQWDYSSDAIANLYLTGRVYDTFDGKEWTQERQGVQGEAFLDTAETLYAVRKYRQSYQRDYLRQIRLEIRYEDFNTGYVFSPLKTWRLEQEEQEKEPEYVCEGGNFRWKGQRGYGTEYALQYFKLNIGQQVFDRFLEEACEMASQSPGVQSADREGAAGASETPGKTDQEIWADVMRECRRHSGENFAFEDMEAYREGIYRDYLKMPELSAEAEAYLEKLTEGAGSKIEKLRKIERGLSLLTYTLTPGELPERVEAEGDFLDYFLLESRQGYCTYFATAFVLLARAEGIPARYVQGYCVPVEKGENPVYSGMAHAWPEAYLEGIGWIPFEPTPGYAGKRYSPWETVQPTGEILPVEEEEAPETDSGYGEDMGISEGTTDLAAKEEEQDSGDQDKETGSIFSWRLFLVAVSAILSGCAAFLILDSVLGRYRYGKMKPAEKLRTEVFRNLELLAWFGLERQAGETLQELRERADPLFGLRLTESDLPEDLEREAPLQFIEYYENVIYGGEEAGEDSIRETVEERRRLLELLKKKKKWAYFYCRMKYFFI